METRGLLGLCELNSDKIVSEYLRLNWSLNRIRLMCYKACLKESHEFSNFLFVYLRSSMLHVEQQTLLKEIPCGKDYRLTGSRHSKKVGQQYTK